MRRATRAALEAGCAPVFAVTGARAVEVEAALAGLAVTPVRNDGFEEGLASSIRAGLAAAAGVTPPCDGALLLLVDQPAVDAVLLRELRARFERERGSRPVACGYGGGLGVPALFPRALFAELSALRGERGAKGVLQAHRRDAIAVPFPGAERDVDREADLTPWLELEPNRAAAPRTPAAARRSEEG